MFDKKDTKWVSIPNGMEFYDNCFAIVVYGFLSFNSQRDGILHGYTMPIVCYYLFQFPTGWNSTHRWKFCKCDWSVSIPNGMEFYLKNELYVRTEFGFNSQRDGILRWIFWFYYRFMCQVSIPNGMEFYPLGFEIYILIFCFNSQRDGILPIMKFCIPPAVLFQFPTGWNSTIFGIIEISF